MSEEEKDVEKEEEEQPEELYDASNPKHVAKALKGKKNRERRKRDVLANLLKSADGRLWMYDLLSDCGVYLSSFSSDPLLMAFKEGRRDVGNKLVTQVHAAGSELFVLMCEENQYA